MALEVLPEETGAREAEPEVPEPPADKPKEEPKDPEPMTDRPKDPEPKEKPEPKARKKRGAPRDPKIQCPECLRFYCGWGVQPGGHVCHPVKLPDLKPTEPTPPPDDPSPESPVEDPEPDPMASSIVMAPEPKLTHSDVVRFMAREKMNRHERKRERWQQQMFGWENDP